MTADRRVSIPWDRAAGLLLLMSLVPACSTTHRANHAPRDVSSALEKPPPLKERLASLPRSLIAIPRELIGIPLKLASIPKELVAVRDRANAFIVYWPPPKKSTELRLAVKDLIDMHGVITTAGSEHVAKTSLPAERDAPCLALARERGVRIVGKTNLTELAITTSGRNRYFGTPISRLDGWNEVIAGGSSSGSAVAVKTGMADVAFGTDTAGSIRTPAACCGIFGLKTSFGLVPIEGVFPISPKHLDTVGPMAKDLPHLVQGMDLLQRGFAARYEKAVAARPSGSQLRIGRLHLDGSDPAIDRAIDQALAAAGCQVIELDEAFKAKWQQAQRHGRTVANADTWLNDQKYRHEKGVRKTTKAVILLGELEYNRNYDAALAGKAEWQRALREVFQKVDLIALPTLQRLPPKPPLLSPPVLFEWQVFNMQNTVAVNYAGNPALSMPIPMPAKTFTVPVTSLQLIGPPRSEAELLNAARIIQKPIPQARFKAGMKAMSSAVFGWME